jgi:hypothetical protein
MQPLPRQGLFRSLRRERCLPLPLPVHCTRQGPFCLFEPRLKTGIRLPEKGDRTRPDPRMDSIRS